MQKTLLGAGKRQNIISQGRLIHSVEEAEVTQRSYCHGNTKLRRVTEYQAAQIRAGRMTVLYYALRQLLTNAGQGGVVLLFLVIKRPLDS